MRGQLFKCTKCGVELPKDKFRKHLMRKTPCYVQSGIDFIIFSPNSFHSLVPLNL